MLVSIAIKHYKNTNQINIFINIVVVINLKIYLYVIING